MRERPCLFNAQMSSRQLASLGLSMGDVFDWMHLQFVLDPSAIGSNTSDGRRIDRSCLECQGGAHLQSPTTPACSSQRKRVAGTDSASSGSTLVSVGERQSLSCLSRSSSAQGKGSWFERDHHLAGFYHNYPPSYASSHNSFMPAMIPKLGNRL
jgi:hypothetical protein